jgi:RHH-type rel operon transcriptional repressor/antitoxin RelB
MFMLYMYSTESCIMLAVRLPADIETRLAALAKETGRTKTFYAREAILRYLEDMEDRYIAQRRLEKPGRRVSMKEAEAFLGLAD